MVFPWRSVTIGIDLMITDNFSSTFTLGMSMCESTFGMIVAEKSGFIAADSLPWSRAYTVLWFTQPEFSLCWTKLGDVRRHVIISKLDSSGFLG